YRALQPALESAVCRRRTDFDCRVSIGIFHEFRILARALSQYFFRQRFLHLRFGSHECRLLARLVQDWRHLRPAVPRRWAGVLLGRHRWAALPSRYRDDSFDPSCQSPGRSAARETRPALSAAHGILGTIPKPRAALSAPSPFWRGHGGVALLAFVIFLQQQLLDQRLLRLLKRSHRSFDNLQRLQGRVIQQAKLASLGEL